MNEIKRLPGDGCTYYVRGRCLYEERLNPGYTQSWRCQVLKKWESKFDDFLARAEFFGVEQKAVPDLWDRQFQRMARDVFHCQMYTYEPGVEPPGCRNQLDAICIHGLPKCYGRCRHYEIAIPEHDEE